MNLSFVARIGLAACIAVLAGASARGAGEAVRIPVSFDAPADGFVSLALYDPAGHLVRSLAYAQPVTKGAQVITWDGTSDLGRGVGAGAYVAKGIFFPQPPSIDFLMKVGKSGNPPYRTPDGTGDWGGNLGGPAGICSNGKSIVMAWSCVEDNQVTGIQQMDADGNIALRYFSFYPWDGRSAAAMDAKNLYLGIFGKGQLQIAEYKLGEPRGKILVKLPAKMPKTASGRWRGREWNQLDGLAVTADRVFASVGVNDELYVIERSSGRIVKTVNVPSACGLAIDGERLLVASGTQVLRYTLDGAADGVAVPAGTLSAANALCVMPDGSIVVGDSGRFSSDPEEESGSKRVYVFDRAGKLVRAIGAVGGAPRNGRFEPARFGDIAGLCAGPDGKSIFVNDFATGFARTTRWSLDGKLERQWFCRKLETSPDAMNPARPTETVKVGDAFDDALTVQAWEMDYAARTWRPAWRYTMPFADCWQDDVITGYEHGGIPLTKANGHPGSWPIFAYGASGGLVSRGGRNYMMNNEGAIWIYAPDHAPRLAAMVFTHRCERKGDRIQTLYDQGPNNWFTWGDANGDAKVQMGEVKYRSNLRLLAETKRMAWCHFDEQMNILFLRLTNEDGSSAQSVQFCKLPLREILPNGAPVYDWDDVREDGPPITLPDLNGGDGTKTVRHLSASGLVDGGDAWYCIAEPGSNASLRLPGIDGEGWWASRNWRKKICRIDRATGECLWAVGRRAPGAAAPGQMYNPIALAGNAGDAVFAADAMGVVWAWDKAGLYLGRLYNGPDDKRADANSMYIEMQGANVIAVGGKVLLLANDFGTSVHEVRLPQRTPVTGGMVTLSSEQAGRVIPWDPDGLAPTEKPTCVVQYLPDHKHDAPMRIDRPIDGREGWEGFGDGTKVQPMLVLLDGQRLATVRALYDERNLYLAYSVTAPNGPINKGSELPISPFVSGAYVDASFAPADWQPRRDDVRDGDVRVILARVTGADGKPADFQHGYWQRKSGGENGQTIKSPAASVRMDQVKEVSGLQMSWRITGRDAKASRVNYDVKVAIPLASIGLADVAGKRIGFDCSVGVANEAGDRRERAGHWAGQSEAAVVDRPGSARLLPSTWGTLEFAAKRK